jgi:Divergent InlB B-repeat domain/PASTA domain
VRRTLAALAAAALCLALPAAAQGAQTLSVAKAGTGTGTVESFPAGIDCGLACSAPFADNSEVTLYAFPGASSGAVTWAGCDSVDAEERCRVTMGSARGVTATFTLLSRTLTVSKAGQGTVTSSPAGISCGGSCQASYPGGTEVTLTGVPAAGYEAPTWTGCNSVDAEGRCRVTMSSTKSVTASFDSASRGLSVAKAGEAAPFVTIESSPAGISCGSDCSTQLPKGAAVTLTALLGPHAKAPQWSGCDSVSEGKCTVTLGTDRSVLATLTFKPGFEPLPLSVAKSGDGQGTVAGDGIECGSVCEAEFEPSTTVELRATAAPGSKFAGWSGDCAGKAAVCRVRFNAARQVTASFERLPSQDVALTLLLLGDGSGLLLCDGGPCAAAYPEGTTVEVAAIAVGGSSFAGFSGPCAGTGPCALTLEAATTLGASFAAAPSLAPPASAPARCLVPKLGGKTLKRAKAALKAAGCSLGKLTRPKRSKGKALRVRSSSPPAGTALAAGAKVGLRLGAKPRAKKR